MKAIDILIDDLLHADQAGRQALYAELARDYTAGFSRYLAEIVENEICLRKVDADHKEYRRAERQKRRAAG